MVARNYTESNYARLLQQGAESGDEMGVGGDFITLTTPHKQISPMAPQLYVPSGVQYYDLNSMTESSCSASMYLGNSATSSTTMEIHQVDSSTLHHQSRKRKASYQNGSSNYSTKSLSRDGSDFEDDTGDDAKSVRTNDDSRKQNHSEIEKRRRDKMNTYIMELSSMVPMCHAMSRKLDKLTVLRMAVQHLKTIRGAVHSYTEGHYKPAFLSDQELKMLILQAAEGFLFVVGCDRGRILYVSESVSEILNYTQGDLLGQSWFDILHPKDVAKVKEQLSSSDLSPRERLIDAKTMLPVKTDVPQGVSRLCPGARRSFFCRMKCKLSTQIKEEADTTTGCHRRKKQQNSDRKYSVIQCTGYLKSWAPAKIGLDEQEGDGDGETCNLSCLVAVGRLQPQISTMQTSDNNTPRQPNVRTIQFISRHAMDGKFLFVDQRATLVLGFLPQELLGTSMYEYYHHEDIPMLAESHKCALQGLERVTTEVYKFRSKEGSFVKLQSEWKSFRNPWTKDVEYLIAKNSVILSDSRTVESSAVKLEGSMQTNFDFFSQSNGRDMQRLINTHVEASKIGRQIAEQVIDSQRRAGDSSSGSSPDPDTNPIIPISTTAETLISTSNSPDHRSMPTPSKLNGTVNNNFSHVRNNVILPNDPESEEEIIKMMSSRIIPESTVSGSAPTDGNDEAAMAVIMSLLEADAGLGGPVDFSGLPWPLP
ncbi:protein cycle isoform X1 [Chrysoperla carnea]|uniref:protein cycle isoform X1 n=1 Tax=Chrysoperla carnea TaxID=189513 RepID=UPI001D07F3F0|nr:protein cycle isoform X1 [Chrysoperla carnea]